MGAVAELGRNSVSKHQIQPEYGDEQADAGQECRTRFARPNSQARTGQVIHFPCSADHEQDWQPYPVDRYSCSMICAIIHTCTHRSILLLYVRPTQQGSKSRQNPCYCQVQRPDNIGNLSASRQCLWWYELHFYCLECVCVFSSRPFWTSSSLDVPAGVTQEEGHTGFLIHLPSAVRALIFVARRIQPFLSLVDREVEFCVLTN